MSPLHKGRWHGALHRDGGVADTGCGIPDEYRTSIFEPFFRVDKSRSREMGGAGLGLALVREIAALHGGTVQDEPAEGAGTVFTVALPM